MEPEAERCFGALRPLLQLVAGGSSSPHQQAVKVPGDLAGIRMRTPGAPVWMETIRAMGATPTPMGWGEVYPALQQAWIDAVEAQHPASFGSRLYEVTKHITKTSHFNLITASWFRQRGSTSSRRTCRRSCARNRWKLVISRQAHAGIARSIEAQFKSRGVTIAEVDKTRSSRRPRASTRSSATPNCAAR